MWLWVGSVVCVGVIDSMCVRVVLLILKVVVVDVDNIGMCMYCSHMWLSRV